MSTETLPDHYQILGVAADADADTIKRAYFRLVRAHRPDEQPERFRTFHEAYETVGDPIRRRRYDQTRRYGNDYRKRLDEANLLMESDTSRAVRLLKEAAVLIPDSHEPRLLLGKAYLKSGDYQSAELELKRLAAQSDDEAALRYDLAYCLWMQNRGDEAEHELQRALKKNPLHHDALLLLAHIYQARQQIDRASECLERAVLLDGSEDWNDFPTLVRLLTLFVLSQRGDDADRIEARIRTIIPDDAANVTEAMRRLYNTAWEFMRNRNPVGAHDIIRRVHHTELCDVLLIEEIAQADHTIARAAEAARMVQDKRIANALQSYLAARYLSEKDSSDTTQFESLAERVVSEAQRNPKPYRLMLDYISEKYPIFIEDETPLLKSVEESLAAGAFLETLKPSVPAESPLKRNRSGWAFWRR